MVDIQPAAAEITRPKTKKKIEEEDRNNGKNIMVRATIKRAWRQVHKW